MTRLYWAMLLIGFCSSSASTIIIRESGESITLKCSSEGCPSENDGYAGMYLYHNFIEQKEVYFYGNYTNSKIMERPRYKGRIESNGAPMNHGITISNLTVDDSGVYTCVYKESADKGVNCSVYTVFVRAIISVAKLYKGKIETEGTSMNHNIAITNLTVDHSGVYSCVYKQSFDHRVECSVYTVYIRKVAPCLGQDDLHTLVLAVITCKFLSVLFIIIFILLIVHRVKQRKCCRRLSRSSQQEPDDYVYEVMTKNNLYTLATSPQQS